MSHQKYVVGTQKNRLNETVLLSTKNESLLKLMGKKIYSNKKNTSDFHGTVSFDPIKMSQQKIYQHVYQTPDTQTLVII